MNAVDALHRVKDSSGKLLSRLRPKTRRGRIILLSLLGIYVAWLIIGGLVLPPVLRGVLEKQLSSNLRATATVEHVSLNPFTLELSVDGVKVPNPDGQGLLFGFKSLQISPSLKSLLRFAPGLAFVRLEDPVVDITYYGGGRFSFSDLIPPADAAEKTESPSGTLFPFALSDFELLNGSFTFTDDVRHVTHTINDIDFIVPFTSTLQAFRETPVTPSLNATIDGSRISVQGQLLPFAETLSTQFTIVTENIDLERFRAYLKEFTPLHLASGAARVKIDLLVEQPEKGRLGMSLNGSLFMDNLELVAPGGSKVAALRSGEVTIGHFTLATRRLELELVSIDGLYLKATKGKDGAIDWARWIQPPAGETAQPKATPQKLQQSPNGNGASTAKGAGGNATASAKSEQADGAVAGGNGTASAKAGPPGGSGNATSGAAPATAAPVDSAATASKAEPPAASQTGFVVSGATLRLTDGTIVWRDESLSASREVAVTGLAIQVPSFSTEGKGHLPFEINLGLNGKGNLQLTGEASLKPVVVKLKADGKDLPLAAAQPFLGNTPAADIAGLLGLHASLDMAQDAAPDSAIKLKLSDGMVTVDKVRLGAAGKQSPLLQLASARLSGITADLAAAKVRASLLKIDGPETHLLVNASGMPVLPSVTGEGTPAVPVPADVSKGKSPGGASGSAADAVQGAPATGGKAQAAATGKDGTVPHKRAGASGKKKQVSVKNAKGSAASKASAAGKSATSAGKGGRAQAHTASTHEDTGTTWDVTLDQIEISNGRVTVQEQTASAPTLTLSDLRLKAGPIGMDQKRKITFDMQTRWQKDGSLSLKGDVQPEPLALDLALRTVKLDLAPFGIALGELTDLQTGGTVTSNIKCDLTQGRSGPRVHVTGGVQLDGAHLRELGARKDFFAVHHLDVQRLDFESSPLRISVGDVAVDKPMFYLVLDRNGVTNVLKALDPAGAEKQAVENRVKAAQDAKAASSGKTSGKVPATAATGSSALTDAVARQNAAKASAADGAPEAEGAGAAAKAAATDSAVATGSTVATGGSGTRSDASSGTGTQPGVTSGDASATSGAVGGAPAAQGKTGPSTDASAMGDGATPRSTPASPFQSFALGKVSIRGGQFIFRDERYKPAYETKLDKIDASISGFSSAPDSRADVQATAMLEGVPLQLSGSMNPVIKPPFVDMRLGLKGFDLAPLSPYALHYIAYPVDKGKLSADIAIKTADWVLKADTSFLLEQIQLGTRDTRPGAPDYPVKLGLALLKGLDGNVSFDLPINGRLDDPNFRLGGVVMHAIMNLMVKVVTSPFALVGGVLSLASGSSGPDMQAVIFEPGRATLTDKAKEKLAGIVNMLHQRPALGLEVVGKVDPATDEQGLKQVALERQMQERKYASLRKGARAETTVDAMTLDSGEYDDYLESIYDDAPFDKPRNVLGLVKGQPREVMEKALFEHMQVAPEDMDNLAAARARAVHEQILADAPDLGERISVSSSTGKGKSEAELRLK